MKTALLIGRFQPFHFGHLYLIKKALSVSDRLFIGIGSSNRTDVKNPLNWRVRKKMLKKVIDKEKLNGKIKEIIPLKDFFNDEKWLNNVVKKTGGFDVVVGNNNWVNRIMKNGGKKIMRVPYYKRYLYEGEKIRRLMNEGKRWESRVPKYLVEEINKELGKIRCQHVVIGGTFDHFHKGHEALIKKAINSGSKVTLGVATKNIYIKKPLTEAIEPYKIRKKSVTDFLKKKKWLSRTKIISFSDFRAGAHVRGDIDAIVVSSITYDNALKINDLRIKNNLDPLKIIIVDNVLAGDKKLLSSERIRAGEIDKDGANYTRFFKKTLFLPKNLRKQLRKPLGKVLKNTGQVLKFFRQSKPIMTLAIGDIISQELEQNKFVPDVKIIDFRSRRHSLYSSTEVEKNSSRRARTVNTSGTINPKSVKAINLAIKKNLSTKKPQTVIVFGEEDLLALPAIVLSPLNSLVLYGQWHLGVIAIQTTEETKEKTTKLLKKFN